MPTNSTVMVTWTSPPSDYVESYRISYTSNDGGVQGSEVTNGDIKELALSEFTPGGSYDFTVEAVSAIESAISAAQSVTLCKLGRNVGVIVSLRSYTSCGKCVANFT